MPRNKDTLPILRELARAVYEEVLIEASKIKELQAILLDAEFIVFGMKGDKTGETLKPYSKATPGLYQDLRERLDLECKKTKIRLQKTLREIRNSTQFMKLPKEERERVSAFYRQFLNGRIVLHDREEGQIFLVTERGNATVLLRIEGEDVMAVIKAIRVF